MDTTIPTLKLFNAVQVFTKDYVKQNPASMRHMLENGYVVEPYTKLTSSLLNTIDGLIGIGGDKVNASFHKSWNKVATASDRQLLLEQMVHYMTVYGFEALGIFSHDTVYIPAEKLDVPNVTDNIMLTLIRCLTADEILGEIVKLGSAGIALSEETLDAIMSIVKENEFDYASYIDDITNRELLALLCDFYGIIPSEPMAYLRYVISKLTGESLVIKNRYLVEKIKTADRKVLDSLLLDAPDNLASIFLRFKPLFLAMKSISRNKTFFNRLRKDAVNMHEPVQADYLSTVTANIKNGTFKVSVLKKALENYSVWRKIRLAYALNNRMSSLDSIVYRVRNGRGWVTDFSDKNTNNSQLATALSATLGSIAKGLSDKVSGQVVYIPANVHYALPSSEKQMVGNIPANSYASVDENLVFGIHWYNNQLEGKYYDRWSDGRVDLDLSLTDINGKYGWDASYRNSSRDILFSGDVTDAPKPNGASELFFVGSSSVTAKLITVNYFNFGDGASVDNCQLVVASERVKDFSGHRNYMINPSNIVLSENVTINKKQNIIGLVVNVDGENRVYFFNSAIGNSISIGDGDMVTKIRNFLVNTCVNAIDLKDVLELAGAVVVNEIPEDGEYLDFSPANLNKTSFIDLLRD